MKEGIAEIIGKRISGVVVKQHPEGKYPRMQLFLLFDDDSYYELYGHDCEIQGINGVKSGDLAVIHQYMGDSAHIVFERHGDS